jgi:hypothetical protein
MYLQDFDGGEIGQAVTQAFKNISSPQQMSWLILDASQFPGGPDEVAQALLDHRCWAAVTSAYFQISSVIPLLTEN